MASYLAIAYPPNSCLESYNEENRKYIKRVLKLCKYVNSNIVPLLKDRAPSILIWEFLKEHIKTIEDVKVLCSGMLECEIGQLFGDSNNSYVNSRLFAAIIEESSLNKTDVYICIRQTLQNAREFHLRGINDYSWISARAASVSKAADFAGVPKYDEKFVSIILYETLMSYEFMIKDVALCTADYISDHCRLIETCKERKRKREEEAEEKNY
jgi:hypothetical protein